MYPDIYSISYSEFQENPGSNHRMRVQILLEHILFFGNLSDLGVLTPYQAPGVYLFWYNVPPAWTFITSKRL